jgi:hypothetical protein
MEELAQAVDEMAQQKSQLKLYRWAVGLLVSTCTCVKSHGMLAAHITTDAAHMHATQASTVMSMRCTSTCCLLLQTRQVAGCTPAGVQAVQMRLCLNKGCRHGTSTYAAAIHLQCHGCKPA